MNNAPRISIRGMLVLTTLVAFCTLPLAVPSKWWMFAFPGVACWLSAFVISRFDLSPVRGRVFWLSLLLGVFVYLAAVAFVGQVSVERYRNSDVWGEEFAMPVWEHMHGTNVFRTNPQGYTMSDFISFFVYVHLICALAFAVSGAGVAQLLAHRREWKASGQW